MGSEEGLVGQMVRSRGVWGGQMVRSLGGQMVGSLDGQMVKNLRGLGGQ